MKLRHEVVVGNDVCRFLLDKLSASPPSSISRPLLLQLQLPPVVEAEGVHAAGDAGMAVVVEEAFDLRSSRWRGPATWSNIFQETQ